MISTCRSVKEMWNHQHEIQVCFKDFSLWHHATSWGSDQISLERDFAGKRSLGRRQDGGKGTKKNRNGVDELLIGPNRTSLVACSAHAQAQ